MQTHGGHEKGRRPSYVRCAARTARDRGASLSPARACACSTTILLCRGWRSSGPAAGFLRTLLRTSPRAATRYDAFIAIGVVFCSIIDFLTRRQRILRHRPAPPLLCPSVPDNSRTNPQQTWAVPPRRGAEPFSLLHAGKTERERDMQRHNSGYMCQLSFSVVRITRKLGAV